jgi:hypothetical protein
MLKNFRCDSFKLIALVLLLLATTIPVRALTSPADVILPLRVDPYVTTCMRTYPFNFNTWRGFQQAQSLYTRYVFDASLAFLPVCLTPPWLVAPLAYVWDGRHNSAQINQTRPLVRHTTPRQAHRIVFHAINKAYVLGDTMHLAYNTPYRVFVHELAHFVAFADEYSLSPELAKLQCFAPGYLNRRVRQQGEAFAYLWQVLDSGGMVVDDPVCSKLTNQQWQKMDLPQWHFLHYNDVRRIPFVYQHMWQWELGLYR